MIGPVNNLFPGRLSTATVLGNYSLYAVKNTFSLSSADTFIEHVFKFRPGQA